MVDKWTANHATVMHSIKMPGIVGMHYMFEVIYAGKAQSVLNATIRIFCKARAKS